MRIVSFCVMFRKCVPDKWGSSYSSRPQMGWKNAANGTRRVCCAGHEVKSGRKWMKKGEFGRKTGNFEWKVPDVRLFVPKEGGEKQEKAEGRCGRGEGGWVMSTI